MLEWAVIALTVLGGQAQAEDEPYVLPEIEIQARAGDPLARFVSDVTTPGEGSRFLGQIARWDHELCVTVTGASAEANTYLAEEIRANFRSLDIPHAEEGCSPTAAVLITSDSDALAEAFVAGMRHSLFQRRHEAIQRFLGPTRPVRWQRYTRTNQQALPNTRLRLGTTRTTEHAIVVVDVEGAASASLEALAAYLAFVAVVDLPSEPSAADQRSILSLFNEELEDRPHALTAWDRAFIGALYEIEPDAPFRLQQNELAHRMRQALEKTE